MIKRFLVLALVAACGLVAQPTPTPSPITAVTFARLPAAGGSTRTYVVTDCLTASCTAGGGTLKITMVSNGSAWSPAGSGGGGGGAPAGSAGCIQLYATSSTFGCGNLTGGQVGGSGSTPTGGWYFSATADENGGGPNQCPVWYWGDAGCTSPASLMLNTDITGDLSASANPIAMMGSYGNFVHTGSSKAIVRVNDMELFLSGSGDYSQVQGNEISLIFLGPSTADQMIGDYISEAVSGGTVSSLYGVYVNLTTGFGNTGTVPVAYDFWAADIGGLGITNPYYSWFDSQGVRRVKEDSTFNSVGQAIEALYNPQFTKYTPGAVNYERIVLGEWESNIAVITTENGGTGTLRNIQIDGAEVDLGTATHLVKINATTFKLGTLTCAVVSTVLTCT